MSLDDFPSRDNNSELSEISEMKFESAIIDGGHFVIQQKDRHDYGTDFQIEVSQSHAMTNFRVHVQLKGTNNKLNQDGSISIQIKRTNLNYLLSQSDSIYICYHEPTDSLLVRSAEDIFRENEHRNPAWINQKYLTIRFSLPFDRHFQSTLSERVLAYSRTERSDRLEWVTTGPDGFVDEVNSSIPTIKIPESEEQAIEVLNVLYQQNKDEVISKAFKQFEACLGKDSTKLVLAYLSEINLAMRDRPFNLDRIKDGIDCLQKMASYNQPDNIYCQANGYLALKNYNESKRLYKNAIELNNEKNPQLEAECWKNLGSVFELENDIQEAQKCYQIALQKSPDLMEAHFALGLSLLNEEKLVEALTHLDQVIWSVEEVIHSIDARGHRLKVYFRLEETEKAFTEIATILPHSDQCKWILPWCAQLVHNYTRTNPDAISHALRFWETYLRKSPNDLAAQKEYLLCLAHAKMLGLSVSLNLQQYIEKVFKYFEIAEVDDSLLWDRIGHWAQVDEQWEEAESAYRKAFDLEPDKYGYCLGTALNFLKRFKESLPILRKQTNLNEHDAMCWFQLAVSQKGVGNIEECIQAFKRAIELDPEYALAYFNLGGIYWNQKNKNKAKEIWSEALKRFPSHSLAKKLLSEFSSLFKDGDEQE